MSGRFLLPQQVLEQTDDPPRPGQEVKRIENTKADEYEYRNLQAAVEARVVREFRPCQVLEEKKIHLIPEGNWSVRDYKEFLEKRKELFLSKMKEAINISSGEKVEVI